MKHESYFVEKNVTQIHNILLHGGDAFANEREWSAVSEAHRFADWGETTDGFSAFLVPYGDRLYLTYQMREATLNYETLDIVSGVEITPHYIITVIDATVALLRNNT